MGIGDHLAVRFGFYQHHGIDVGDGQVVHFGRGLHELENACVEIVPREKFADGRPIVIIESAARFPSDVIVERAISAIGSRNYDLWQNNCEHFANWCRSDNAVSRQSQQWRAGIRITLSAAVRRVAVRRLAGRLASPNLAAEGVQMAVEMLASRRGIHPPWGQTLGVVAGSATAAAVGFMRGGPAAATLHSGIYVGCQAVAGRMTDRLCGSLPKFIRRWTAR